MDSSIRHSTRVYTGGQVAPQWRRIVDELARHGMLGCLGATEALLSTGATPRPRVTGTPIPAQDAP